MMNNLNQDDLDLILSLIKESITDVTLDICQKTAKLNELRDIEPYANGHAKEFLKKEIAVCETVIAVKEAKKRKLIALETRI